MNETNHEVSVVKARVDGSETAAIDGLKEQKVQGEQRISEELKRRVTVVKESGGDAKLLVQELEQGQGLDKEQQKERTKVALVSFSTEFDLRCRRSSYGSPDIYILL